MARRLDYDTLICEHGAVTVRKGQTPIGIVAERSPTWAWYVGALGKVIWLVGSEDLIGRKPGDPPWLAKTMKGLTFDDVEIILLQGDWGLIDEQIWESKAVKLILKAPKAHLGNRGSRGEKHRRKRRRLNATSSVPNSWKVGSIYLKHEELGGVTSGSFQIEWASPRGSPEPEFVYPPGLSVKLGQVVNRKLKGIRTTAPTDMQVNSSLGTLRWRKRFQEVIVPYSYRPNVWTSRRLSPEEMAQVLDFPPGRLKGLSQTKIHDLTVDAVPGKVLGACLWFLGEEKDGSEKILKDRKRALPVELTPSKQARTMMIPEQSQQAYEGIGPDEACSTGDLVIKRPTLATDSESGYANKVEREEDRAGTATDKATKADDAAVPVFLWNDRIQEGLEKLWEAETGSGLEGTRPLDFTSKVDQLRFKWALNKLRQGCLTYWKRKVKTDFEKWYQLKGKSHPHAKQVWIDGQAAVAKASQASWWNWDKGSSIFFWRWPADYQETVRVGLAPMFDTEAPHNRDQQPAYECEEVRAKVKKKLDNVLMKGYIELTDIKLVEAMMFMFHVPKGETDIRMVYDGTKSGLNDSLFSYWFALPTVNSMVRWVVAGSWLADNDYGEQFLNFPLHPDIRKLCGVDLSQLYPEQSCGEEGKDSTVTGAWMRSAMGLKTSPYNAVQGSQRAKRIILGDPRDPLNPFHWATIKLNLPGTENYNPAEPWIQKMRADGLPAAEIVQYVDDVRIIAPTEELAWLCSSQMAKGLSFLGLQDAARKRRKPSQTPGAWAGATVSSNGDVVRKGVTKERWEKVKLKVRWIADQIGLSDSLSPSDYGDLNDRRDESGQCPQGCIHYKTMESFVGFLVYVSMTYTSMVPYLKGIYLSLNSWREGRDADGWPDERMKRLFDEGINKNRVAPDFRSKRGHPIWSKTVPRLKDDLRALMRLTSHEDPPLIPVRPTNTEACYVVGDASGAGFGSSSYKPRFGVVNAEYGTWTPTVTNERSSNFRETANLAGRIKRMLKNQDLKKGSEVFVFTDNSCAESTMYKGSSKSRLLHEMVLDLRAMEMAGDIIVHFVWISGKRMIWQGGDGLSRGDFTSGAMAGEAFLKFLPLHENAVQRCTNLEKDIFKWLPKVDGMKWKVASVKDWFHEVFLDPEGSWIWIPPPVLAKVAVEQMCEVKHLFPKSKHLFICPSIMTGVWRKQLLKVADCQFSLINGCKQWPEDMYEPLTVALLSPPLFQSPWKSGRSPRMEEWKQKMCALQWNDPDLFRSGMREFWMPGQWC